MEFTPDKFCNLNCHLVSIGEIMTYTKHYLLIGLGGHSNSMEELLKDSLGIDRKNIEKIDYETFTDGKNKAHIQKAYPVDECYVYPAVGDPKLRRRIFDFIESFDYMSPTLKSRQAMNSENSVVDFGTVLMPGAVIRTGVHIGKGCVINTGAVIEHDVKIGDFVNIGPNATICGGSKIGNYSVIGAGATVIDKLTLVNDVVLGAGALCLASLNESGTYFGSPARYVKK